MADNDCAELAGAVYEQLKHYSRQENITNFDEVVDALRDDFPELDREQLVEHIVNVSSERAKVISDAQKKLSLLKNEARKEHRLVKKIEEVQKVLEDQSTLSKTGNPTKEPSETVSRLRRELKGLMEEYNESTPATVQKLQKQIHDLQEKLANNDFALPIDKETLPTSPEVKKLELKKKELQDIGRKKLSRLRDEQMVKRAVLRDAFNLTKALRSSFDAGFVGRQGLLVAVTHPKMALNAFGDAAIAAWNPERAHRMEQDMMENEFAVQFMGHRGRIATDTDLNEESYAGRIEGMLMQQIKRIPGYDAAAGSSLGEIAGFVAGKIGGGMRASERAHRTFLNKLRVDYYTSLAMSLPSAGNPTEAEGRAIANLVNTMTGYGELESAGTAMATAQNIFWSARYQLSRFQMLVGGPLWTAPKSGHKTNVAFGLKLDSNKALVAQEYAKIAIGMFNLAGLMGIAAIGYGKAVGDDDEVFEGNATASRFWTVKFGNQYIDFSSGLRTWAVMLSRFATGELETRSGETQDIIGEDTRQVSATDIGASFLRGKTAPLVSTGLDLVAGRPFEDDTRPNPLDIGVSLAVPLPVEVFMEELTENGFSPSMARVIADFAGFPPVN